MNDIISMFSSSEAWVALGQIILIDLVLSGDNAIVISLATRHLPAKLQRDAFFVGVAGATVLRIILSIFAVYLLSVVGIQFAGGLLLLYVVRKLYKMLRTEEGDNHNVKQGYSFMHVVRLIILADVSMSLDNVLAVAGASHGNVVMLGIGLVFSIICMGILSKGISVLMKKMPFIQRAGLLIILIVAIDMILGGSEQLAGLGVPSIVISGIFLIMTILFIIAHYRHRYIFKELAIKHYLETHYYPILLGLLLLVFIIIAAGHVIFPYLHNNTSLYYALMAIVAILMLEVVYFMTKK